MVGDIKGITWIFCWIDVREEYVGLETSFVIEKLNNFKA